MIKEYIYFYKFYFKFKSGEHHQSNGQGNEQTGCRDGIEGCPKTGRVSETTP